MKWLKEAALKHKRIKNIEEIKRMVDEQAEDFIVVLGIGGSFTRYRILWEDPTFWVLSYADDSERDLTPEQFMDPAETNFAEAMRKGAFYWEE